MSLTTTDKKEMREMMVDTVSSALEEIVVPRLDKLEGRMDKLEGRMDGQERATNDLRDEMRSGFSAINKRIDELEGKVEALENDIKELYTIVRLTNGLSYSNKKFNNLSVEQKILQTHAQLVTIAKQAGIVLPS